MKIRIPRKMRLGVGLEHHRSTGTEMNKIWQNWGVLAFLMPFEIFLGVPNCQWLWRPEPSDEVVHQGAWRHVSDFPRIDRSTASGEYISKVTMKGSIDKLCKCRKMKLPYTIGKRRPLIQLWKTPHILPRLMVILIPATPLLYGERCLA